MTRGELAVWVGGRRSFRRVARAALRALPRSVALAMIEAAHRELGSVEPWPDRPGRHRTPFDVIVRSRLFDPLFYGAQAGLPPDLESCVEHYLEHGAAAGYRPNRLFDGAAYLALHRDVAAAGLNPFAHFLTHGLREGRQNIVPDDCLAEIAALTPESLAERRIAEQARRLGWRPDQPSAWASGAVAVYASSLGNFFFRHIADRIAEGLRADGLRVYRLDQNSERPADTAVDFFVAPHEFFLLGGGRTWQGRPELARSVMLNTEQPGTHWYFLALSYAGPRTTLLELSPQSAVVVRDLGRAASGYLPLGWVSPGSPGLEGQPRAVSPARGLEVLEPEQLVWPPEGAWRHRPIDVLFLGTLTPRRSAALARLAPALARYRCFIHAPTGWARPLVGGKTELGLEQSLLLARQAKVMLNLHRNAFPFFEWHRVMTMGVEQGAVVLSEPCLPSPGVEPERHYLAAAVKDMPLVLERLLGSSEGEDVARAIGELGRSELPQRFDLRAELRALSFLHTRGFSLHA